MGFGFEEKLAKMLWSVRVVKVDLDTNSQPKCLILLGL